MPSPSSNVRPLSRYTVLDLTIARAGPTAVRLLSDWGADVIRIDSPPDKEVGGNERSRKLKFHSQTSGRSLHTREIAFNDIRTTPGSPRESPAGPATAAPPRCRRSCRPRSEALRNSG